MAFFVRLQAVVRGVFNLLKPKAAKHSSATRHAETLDRARSVQRQGRAADALAICRGILEHRPDDLDTLLLTAEMTAASGEFDRAIQSYRTVIDLKPDHAVAHYKLGNLLRDRQQMEAALASYDEAVALDPGYAHAFCNRGFVLERLGRWAAALDSYDRAIALAPGDALAHYNRAAVLRELGRQEDALASYTQAIAVRPDYCEAYCNRGFLLTEMKRFDEALASQDQSIEIDPSFAPAHFGRGTLLHLNKEWNAALASYDRAIEIDPGYALAYCSRGKVLLESKQWSAARSSLERAIALKSDLAEAYDGLALALAGLGYLEAAVSNSDKAIALDSNCAQAYLNRANFLIFMKRFAPAIADYDRGFALEGDTRFLLGMREYARASICDWSGRSACVQRLINGIEAGEMLSPPMPTLALVDSARLQHKAARLWTGIAHPTNPELPALSRGPRSDKPRIGYFSADFREHPVAALMAGVFEAHDRSRFEVIAFSYGADPQDDTRKRLEKAFDRFIDVRAKTDREIALLAREMEIDIAVDLGGHTGGSRAGIFALRAAPLQVNYLGYAGTMGADYMDYLIGDETVVPEAHELHYDEKIVRLPHSFMPHDSKRPISSTVYGRDELGLPSGGFVFCCFNNNYKITPDVFDGWMRILQRVPNSVLWLSENNEQAAESLRRESRHRGIDAERLIFAPRMPSPADHLARHRAADLFLDTRPYNAHATAMDALWAGLPVLTLPGEGFAARVAASLLTAVQLPELIAKSPEDYENIAVRLAENPQLTADMKQRLARNRSESALFDTGRFAKYLEDGYSSMLDRLHAGLPPGHIRVPA
jgi:predicted O-linked N-acetylglucosamine transferase (SPINDLY family)